ncbi:hypothetical protein BO94DRAFT_536882 [Aspergillus sclerotioniger CBS 115572]|uniref:SRR1-like domain-containing protein n=1 Tax=Aspergillus sclerotioniger CBS 115572 TaxID=1450535 RepID=A0A317W7H7_9EURO|nr:hypothetical protein BO94DRAFT_536882 [Aspergillus sclerotioniger CBS 115572]PWY81631.1 hypothetical protein BO94DRAFT_536882 [Aspergillus sclerotioniger CBS 115572]
MNHRVYQESIAHWGGYQDEFPRNRDEVLANLTKWYSEGRPLLTKDALRNVQEQLNKPLQEGDKVWTIGYDGVKVGWEGSVKLSQLSDEEEYMDGLEYYVVSAHMFYHPFCSLKRNVKYYGDTDSAYSSLSVMHLLGQRDIVTKLPPVCPSYTTEESRDVLQRSIRAWEVSETCSHLKNTLSSVLSRHPIDKIVGFSCSSISRSGCEDRDLRYGIQHALLLTVRSLLERTTGCTTEHEVSCYIQDPAYNDVDKTVFQEQGMQVVDDPQGFLEVDESSIIFSCASNVAVKEMITELARPAIIIWDKVEESQIATGDEDQDAFDSSTDPISPRVFDMISNCYDSYTFLPDLNFTEMAVYVRK